MTPLTDRQRQVLRYIYARLVGYQTTPTVREICAHLGVTSSQTAWSDLQALHAKGYLEGERNRVRLTERALRELGQ